ncbi:unnamed protein product [Cuscuta europaea]|uniref:Allyl alcohol dehydrogenase-like protein n=1 Tax=Cuscuta europaea TaxID=41803 RepID=A0A9P1EL45_CUSEU|nr:unnamed protein product [Cuscuta europaea]
MGILSWFRGGNKQAEGGNNRGDSTSFPSESASKTNPGSNSQSSSSSSYQKQEASGPNGAVEVSRPLSLPEVTVFEFGFVATSADKVTISGYCPVSDELEPCRWEILPASASDAPQFRVVF